MDGLLSQLYGSKAVGYPMSNPISQYLEDQGNKIKGAVGSVIRNYGGGGLGEAIANTALDMAPFTPSGFSQSIGTSLLGGLAQGESVPRQLSPSLLKELIERSGGKYKGIQDWGGDVGKWVNLDEPITGSTGQIKIGDVNPKNIANTLAQIRAAHGIK